jgi:uncharacterized protein involved in response to NO
MKLFGRGFRPFFLLASAHAVVFVPIWLCVGLGWIAPPKWLWLTVWHAHEMIFGFCAAAIAGFLLTSVPAWTGTAALAGGRLAGLAALWLAGRVVMAAAGRAPWLAAAVDLAFLPVLALAIGPPIYRAGVRHNFGFPIGILALAAANALMHAEALGASAGTAAVGLRAGVDLVALLVVVIGGRVTPSFTTNALRRAGITEPAGSPAWAERASVPAFLLFLVIDLALPVTIWSGGAALLAAIVLAARMSGWQTRRALGDPLLWSLHLGQAWVVLGLFCLAAADLAAPWKRNVAIHALTAGAFGTMILAMMTRVALGHTGRPMVAPRSAVVAYVLVTIAALLRSLGVAAFPADTFPMILLGGLLWAGAFAAFLVGYVQILTAARVDGRPG